MYFVLNFAFSIFCRSISHSYVEYLHITQTSSLSADEKLLCLENKEASENVYKTVNPLYLMALLSDAERNTNHLPGGADGVNYSVYSGYEFKTW